MSTVIEKWTFTVDDYHRMLEVGILLEDEHIELIDGEIIKMSPIGRRHAACVKRLNLMFHQQVGSLAVISVQDPIRLDEFSEPEPDIALLKPRDDFYESFLPRAEDVLLVVEVSDTSVEYDRNVKLPLYARAGIPEVWLVIPSMDCIEVYTEPITGLYHQVHTMHRGESVEPKEMPQIMIWVDKVLGEKDM